MKKIIFPLLLCIILLCFISAADIQEELSGNLIRMHIIANSNSEEDQSIKLAVRNEILKNCTEIPSADILSDNAKRALSKMNVPYTAYVKTERCYVPEKEYKNIRLPEGVYDCIKVVLGNGNGENWWCVAYPPLCFTEEVFGGLSEEGKNYLTDNLSREALETVIKNGNVNFKFKTVELFQKLRFN